MDSRTADEVVRALARRQHGVIGRTQLRRAGVSPDALYRRIGRGVLEAVSANVLRLAGAPETDLSVVMAGVLDAGPGAAASHHTDAALWGLPGFSILPVHAIGTRDRVRHGRSDLAIVHQPCGLLRHHVVELDLVPVTTPTRLLFDLAGASDVHPKRLERLLDTAWSRGLVSHRSLRRGLEELAVRGRPGIALMRELIAARPQDYLPPGSGTEARFKEIAAGAGLPDLVRQLDVGDEDGWVGRVDYVDRRRRLIVEVDPPLWHASLTDRREDKARRARLRAAGWTVEVVTDFEIFHARAALSARLRQLAYTLVPVD